MYRSSINSQTKVPFFSHTTVVISVPKALRNGENYTGSQYEKMSEVNLIDSQSNNNFDRKETDFAALTQGQVHARIKTLVVSISH